MTFHLTDVVINNYTIGDGHGGDSQSEINEELHNEQDQGSLMLKPKQHKAFAIISSRLIHIATS